LATGLTKHDIDTMQMTSPCITTDFFAAADQSLVR